MKLIKLTLYFFIFAATLACTNHKLKQTSKTLLLIPIGKVDLRIVDYSYAQLKQKIPTIQLAPEIDFPNTAYVKTRNRFRADTCLKHLAKKYGYDTIAIGLTSQDLSTTKNGIADWGIMGLGQRPGKACIISTYRLNVKNKQEQVIKVLLHEIGHTQNLKHCPNKACLMRDAEGGNPLNDEKDFCLKCKKLLKTSGVFSDISK